MPYLTAAFLRETAERLGKPRGLTTNAEAMLASAPWEGNARELRNVIERACMLADGPMVTEQDVLACLPLLLEQRPSMVVALDDGRTLSTVEREHIMKALQRVGGNKKAAARMLGVSRRALTAASSAWNSARRSRAVGGGARCTPRRCRTTRTDWPTAEAIASWAGSRVAARK